MLNMIMSIMIQLSEIYGKVYIRRQCAKSWIAKDDEFKNQGYADAYPYGAMIIIHHHH